ncbi:DUF1127 domain-containing protein [Ensifer sp. 4252]|uniref:DUF1127 domain-containing protein n=1 Tax=Ensifer sp. 4252 TaxID=3373915 RepID=UPI003D20860C
MSDASHDNLIHVSTRLIAPRERFAPSTDHGTRGFPWVLLARISRWTKTRRGRLDLLALSDHQLKDIGLSRGAAYNDFYKRDE